MKLKQTIGVESHTDLFKFYTETAESFSKTLKSRCFCKTSETIITKEKRGAADTYPRDYMDIQWRFR